MAAVSAEVLAAEGVEALVAPALSYGASGEHQGFAGTLSIGQEALESVVVELVPVGRRRLPRSWSWSTATAATPSRWPGPCAPCAHEGRAGRSSGRPASPRGDSHAGRTETSLLLAISPETVRLDRAEPGVTTPLPELIAGCGPAACVAVTPNGVLGDPTGATAEEGRSLLAALVADLVAAVHAAAEMTGLLERAWQAGGSRRRVAQVRHGRHGASPGRWQVTG